MATWPSVAWLLSLAIDVHQTTLAWQKTPPPPSYRPPPLHHVTKAHRKWRVLWHALTYGLGLTAHGSLAPFHPRPPLLLYFDNVSRWHELTFQRYEPSAVPCSLRATDKKRGLELDRT